MDYQGSFAFGERQIFKGINLSVPRGKVVSILGVGGSGKGKSRTMKAILSCFKGQDSVITDATPEALTKNMADSPRGSMLELAEGKEFASMFGRYSENGKGDSSLFNKTWSGDRIRVIRQKGTVWVDNPFLTIAAAIQGSNLAQLPHGDMMDGLLQRMIIFPIGDSAKKWDREALKKHSEFITEWQEIVKRLQSVKAIIGSGAPQVMSVSAPCARASATRNSSLRVLLPPGNSPSMSSRLTHTSGPWPPGQLAASACEKRGMGSRGVGCVV